MKTNLLKIVYLILLTFSLGGCGEDMVAVSIVGINYNDYAIDEYSVDGYPAFNVSAHGGGGKFVCCVNIPREWRHDLKVTIRWQDHDDEVKWKTKVVNIPEYKETGTFMVHFFPNDEVKVLVSRFLTGHPNNPYPYPAPSDCGWGVSNSICKERKNDVTNRQPIPH